MRLLCILISVDDDMGPYEIQLVENVFITLSDGCKLAVKMWLPVNAPQSPVPAILEYLPYRKRDGTVIRDTLTHPYLASYGYACLRVDMRGSGESDGLLVDEYLKQEQDDCLEVLRWIATQKWCTGDIGMIGISWGGFNSLQVAALRPPELKAIISLCSTDDRYNDDIHYMGGCLLTADFQWSSTMLAMMSRAPDQQLLGGVSREIWLNRIKEQPLLASTWLKHPNRDAYWKHGSICENWEAITCPVYLVGGWADGYSNTIPRMLENLKCDRKGLIGPWAHKYPHFAKPGPQIGFLQEALRWWDKWLKGIETHIMEEPMYRVWMQESVPPHPSYEERAGRWIAEKNWPSEHIQNIVFSLAENQNRMLTKCSSQSVGETAGAWYSYGIGPDKSQDQCIDDARSICFDLNPLTERLEIFGAPMVELDLAVDQSDAFIAVRLNEVSPNGESTRITYGLLNLVHRQSQESATSIVPGERMRICVKLNDVAHAFSPGNHLRIAISTTYWPLVWPSPQPVNLSIFPESARLILPLRKPREEDNLLPSFQKPDSAPSLDLTYFRPYSYNRYVERNLNNNTVCYRVVEDSGDMLINAIGLRTDYVQEENYIIRDDDPLSAIIEIKTNITITNKDGLTTCTQMVSSMTASKTEYHVKAQTKAYEGDQLVLTRDWDYNIPRQKNVLQPLSQLSQMFSPSVAQSSKRLKVEHPSDAHSLEERKVGGIRL